MIAPSPPLWNLARVKPGSRVAIVANIPDLIETNNWHGWRHYSDMLRPGQRGQVVDVLAGRMLVEMDDDPATYGKRQFIMPARWLVELHDKAVER